MTPTQILYEPTAIGRIGVRKKDGEVVFGTDYSCFAYMLEEYISYGVFSIVIPSSSPEISLVNDFPDLLRKRLKLVDDANDNEVVARVLFNLRNEFNIELLQDNTSLSFPKGLDHTTRNQISKIHADVRRLAFGFNHGVHIELNTSQSVDNIRQIRNKSRDTDTRILLSHIEGILSRYDSVSFGSIVPKDSNPRELISIFDRLLNDPEYIVFSRSVSKLNEVKTRQRTLVELREFARRLSSSRFVGATWDYITKILKVWPGVPLPESKDLAGIMSGRTIPSVVDLTERRARAVENWFSYAEQNPPLWRDGRHLGEDVDWLPPAPSMKAGGPDSAYLSIGRAGELVQLLMDFEQTKSASTSKTE
jgi:hypothetical protein